MTTVGELLQEKMGNMKTWLATQMDVVPDIALTPTIATVVASRLLDALDAIRARDFEALLKHPDLPFELVEVGVAVSSRPELHDKFWRYMDLFVSCVA